jgi:hypothetical protein
VDVEVLAEPPTRVIGAPATPSIVNVTVPVGVAVPLLGDTVAVNVTVWPNVLGFCGELTLVVVGVGLLTVWKNAMRAPPKVASP